MPALQVRNPTKRGIPKYLVDPRLRVPAFPIEEAI